MKDYEDYGAYWDQVDEPAAREPLPAEPQAVDLNAKDSGEMADEFDRAEPSAVREPQADARPAEKTGPASFGDAFKAARAAGQSKFQWNGKWYTTELKGTSKPAVARPAEQPTERPAEPANQAEVRRAEPQARGLNMPKPSMYSRSVADDVRSAVQARHEHMNSQPMFNPKGQP